MSKVFYDYDHWSSPNGCAEGCPACANEARKETERDRLLEEIAALHRLHAAAPALLKALRDIAGLDSDAHPGLAMWQEARSQAHREAIAAIALTEPPNHPHICRMCGDPFTKTSPGDHVCKECNEIDLTPHTPTPSKLQ